MAPEQQFNDFVVEHDFTETPEMDGGAFQNLPQGEYVFDITFLEQKPSSTNNPAVKVTFQVAEAEAQINDEAKTYAGQKAWNTYPLLPQSYGRLKKLMVACRTNLTQFRASEVLGSRIIATITHSLGEARADANGNPQEPKTFANVSHERPLDDVQVATTTTPPPVMNKAKPGANGAAKPAQGATRRA